jgi:hypothetical protein
MHRSTAMLGHNVTTCPNYIRTEDRRNEYALRYSKIPENPAASSQSGISTAGNTTLEVSCTADANAECSPDTSKGPSLHTTLHWTGRRFPCQCYVTNPGGVLVREAPSLTSPVVRCSARVHVCTHALMHARAHTRVPTRIRRRIECGQVFIALNQSDLLLDHRSGEDSATASDGDSSNKQNIFITRLQVLVLITMHQTPNPQLQNEYHHPY